MASNKYKHQIAEYKRKIKEKDKKGKAKKEKWGCFSGTWLIPFRWQHVAQMYNSPSPITLFLTALKRFPLIICFFCYKVFSFSTSPSVSFLPFLCLFLSFICLVQFVAPYNVTINTMWDVIFYLIVICGSYGGWAVCGVCILSPLCDVCKSFSIVSL